MKKLFLWAMLGAALPVVDASAQAKVAEGEYHLRSADSDQRANTAMDRWILYSRKQGGYRLESEVTSASTGTGVIVIQTEELTEQFSPTAINIRLYTREDTKKPFSTLSCRLSVEQIACKAGAEELTIASEVDQKGPVLLAVNSLERIDLVWMLSAAIGRAHFEDNKASLPTLVLQDGEDGPELAQTEVDVLRDEGKDPLEISRAKVAARRYRLASHGIKCWTSDSGLLLRMENEDGAVVELAKFKQYRKLLPELPVAP